MQPRAYLLGLLAFGLSACADVAGLDNLRFESTSSSSVASGSGGASSSSGASSAGGTGGGTASASTSSSGMPGRTCRANGTDSLSDAFDLAVLDAQWNTYGARTDVLAFNGRLRIEPPMGSANQYGGIISAASFDLRDCFIAVELVTPPTVPTATAFFSAVIDPTVDNVVEIAVKDGEVSFRIRADGSLNFEELIPHVPAEHRWWRIREDGLVHFELSKDGISWIEHAVAATPAFAGSVRVQAAAGIQSASSVTATIEYDNLNVLP